MAPLMDIVCPLKLAIQKLVDYTNMYSSEVQKEIKLHIYQNKYHFKF